MVSDHSQPLTKVTANLSEVCFIFASIPQHGLFFGPNTDAHPVEEDALLWTPKEKAQHRDGDTRSKCPCLVRFITSILADNERNSVVLGVVCQRGKRDLVVDLGIFDLGT